MNLRVILLASAATAALISLSGRAQQAPAHSQARLGVERPVGYLVDIQIRNLRDEKLGRIEELALDIVNGRIVEVLVKCDSSLSVGNKIVAVPPLALISDPIGGVFRLDISTEVFKTAPAINMSKWEDFGRGSRVAAAYRFFGQEPYFLEQGEVASGSRPKVPLGYVERSIKILDMPVGNLHNVAFGTVSSFTLDIPRGRVLSVIVLAPGNFKTRSVVPAMALSFNDARTGLVLDETKIQYNDEPRFVLTDSAYGQKAYTQEESYEGPRTLVALRQGTSYRDIDRTVLINLDIRANKIPDEHVQVGTLDGRVTLRGWVYSESDKRRIGEIAILDSRLELVDNQISVGAP
jgi:sporulation protein YlmC with PRC-barrel domain